MGCRHEKLECTNNVLRCMVCSAVLPLEVLKGCPHPSAPEALPPSSEGKTFGDDGATVAAGEGFGDDGATVAAGEGFGNDGATAAAGEAIPSSVSREAAATFPQGKAFGDESRENAEPAKAARKKKGRAAAAIPNP